MRLRLCDHYMDRTTNVCLLSHFTPNNLRSKRRKHLGDRTTTIPINLPPLPETGHHRLFHYTKKSFEVIQKETAKAVSFMRLFSLPIGNRFGLFIQANIALMAGRLDFFLLQSLQNRTALLFHMGAVLKPALVQIGRKFPEGML